MKFHRVRVLTEEARNALAEALAPDADEIEQEIRAGVCELWRSDRAYCVTRIEGGELVVVAYAGRDLEEASADFLNAARAAGLRTLRMHTRSPAMARLHHRLIRHYRVEPVEFISRIKV